MTTPPLKSDFCPLAKLTSRPLLLRAPRVSFIQLGPARERLVCGFPGFQPSVQWARGTRRRGGGGLVRQDALIGYLSGCWKSVLQRQREWGEKCLSTSSPAANEASRSTKDATVCSRGKTNSTLFYLFLNETVKHKLKLLFRFVCVSLVLDKNLQLKYVVIKFQFDCLNFVSPRINSVFVCFLL